jgi:CDP-glucose 4,6-dehydratase
VAKRPCAVGRKSVTREMLDWYRGRRVFITGHTGFKGAWLTAWLRRAGARITGYAHAPEDKRDLFETGCVATGIQSILGDVRDRRALEESLRASSAEVVFHLAAQSLVRRSYREPVETYETNVLGTANLLDAARRVPELRAIVVVTSDKCYENRGLARGYTEDDPMGGHDPYSSSKGCAELVTSAYRRSFFSDGGVAVASARAGNVIGGGDWAEDRLVPDIARAASAGATVVVRSPEAVRPWQFVLEPLRGYLMLGRALVERGQAVAGAWNFGPRDADTVPVRDLVDRMRHHWDRVAVDVPAPSGTAHTPHEAALLRLDCAKAHTELGWEPVLSLDDAVEMTVHWYRAFDEDAKSAPALLGQQLEAYEGMVESSEVSR